MNILQKQPGETNEDAAYRLLRTKLRTGTRYGSYVDEIVKCCAVDQTEALRLAGVAYRRLYTGK